MQRRRERRRRLRSALALGNAAMAVLELAFMTGRPDAYIDWKIEQAKKARTPQPGQEG